MTRGNHALVDSPFAPLRGWFPIEVFHFPLRSLEQCQHKARLQGDAWKHIERTPTAYHAQMFEALESGTIADYYAAQVVGRRRGRAMAWMPGDSSSTRGCETRSESSRRGGAPLDFPTPTLVDEATYAVEAAVLGEADVVRLQRRLDTLEERLSSIELRLPNRIYRKASAPGEARARPVTIRPVSLLGARRRPRRAGRGQRAHRR